MRKKENKKSDNSLSEHKARPLVKNNSIPDGLNFQKNTVDKEQGKHIPIKGNDRLSKSPESKSPSAKSTKVTVEEKELLEKAAKYNFPNDEDELKNALVDTRDGDNEPLNEQIYSKDLGAEDLDIPDEYEDDEDEELGKDQD